VRRNAQENGQIKPSNAIGDAWNAGVGGTSNLGFQATRKSLPFTPIRELSGESRMKRRWLSVRESFVRGGKHCFSVVKREPSSKFDRKTPNSQSERTNGVERKNVRRSTVFKSDDWYEKAALSITIGAKS